MNVRSIFPALYMAPEDSPPRSRNATLYLMRSLFYMGIRNPPQRFFVIYILWSLTVNIFSTFYQPIGFAIGLYTNLKDLDPGAFISSLEVATAALSCSVKVLILWINVKCLDSAAEFLDELDKRVIQPSEKRMIHRTVMQSNRTILLFMSVYMGFVMATFVKSVWNVHPGFQVTYPLLDWQAGGWRVWVQLIAENLSMLFAALQNACADCYPINFVLPLRAHVNFLAERLRRLSGMTNESSTPEQRYQELKNCILDHKAILRCSDALSPIISGTIFIQFLLVGLIVGFTMINIVLFANFSSGLASLLFLFDILLETTPFCILCNYLIDDCSKLSDALFESEWMDNDKRYRQTVVFFLHNLQQPITFTAMGIFTISLSTNINVTKFGFSVFTLVKQMNLLERLSNNGNEIQYD
ncbi:odorant receptor 42a-like [Scaptodrosophila lebanonensis]|uniref:Odorant receptor n=1 Tax=Drosophila lebanonensis TaxID=7225 RepID=A0A6J2T0W4_DROLE|nr:odorant receptor 42a-like [Scaptodrosophila lebanonensis]